MGKGTDVVNEKDQNQHRPETNSGLVVQAILIPSYCGIRGNFRSTPFMALSILSASLPAPGDLITPTQRRSPSKKVRSDTIFYSYANSMITRTR